MVRQRLRDDLHVEEVYNHGFLEAGMVCHKGPHGEGPGWIEDKGTAGPAPLLGFSQEEMGKAVWVCR